MFEDDLYDEDDNYVVTGCEDGDYDEDYDAEYDESMDGDFDSAMASAGYGMDEDYSSCEQF